MTYLNIKHRIDVSAGRKPADLLLCNAKVVSVLADEIIETDVAIADGVIVGFGAYNAEKKIDLAGGYLSSGLIDSHIHIESTLLNPAEFARVVVPRGTTSVIADPHEIANVLGSRGVKWMIDASKDLPLDIYIDLPSCVPASKFESAAAKLGVRELKKLAAYPRVVGLGEVMDFVGVIAGKEELLEKIRLMPGMRVDGHAPGLTGKDLYAYIAAGIHSDHESTTAKEAAEKLMAGLHIMIREGTTEKNLEDIAKMVTPANSHRCFFCSDDKSASDLLRDGHIDDTLRRAVKCGIPAITALQMATNNAPYYFRLKRRKGAVAVGYIADLVVFDDLENFHARMVFKNGKLVAENGELKVPCRLRKQARIANTMHVKVLTKNSFAAKKKEKKVRAIRIVPGQIVTRSETVDINSDDVLKLSIIERHHNTGRIGIGFVRGFGLKKGAIASTVCHDAHNLIVAGCDDESMLAAANALIKCGGGFCAAVGRRITGEMPLPIAGLMSNDPAKDVSEEYLKVSCAAKELGCVLLDPFLSLSFLGLSVIPELRLTDRGILDVNKQKII